MIRLVFSLLLIYICYKVVAAFFGKTAVKKTAGVTDSATESFKDPVCGLYVAEDDAVVGRLDGEKYFFCSNSCLEKFRDKLN